MVPFPALNMQPGFPAFQQPARPPQQSTWSVTTQPAGQSVTSSTTLDSTKITMDRVPGTNNWQVNYTNTTRDGNKPPRTQTFKNVVPQHVIQTELDDMLDINRQLDGLAQSTAQTPQSTPADTNPFGIDLNALVNELLADMDDDSTTLAGHQFTPQQLKITIDL